ncbi:hypothetical protein A9977_26275 [Variovorax sp. UMC13]|nr:hypothetical protein [Variovorax sp. UMC13]
MGLLVALCAARQALAAAPSFDCSRAEGAVQQAVCQDDMLAALDRENARLYTLARKASGQNTQQRKTLAATQRGWIKGRDDCWKSTDAKACTRDAYVVRIAELRAALPPATRRNDRGSLSIGPLAVRCPGDAPALNATFVNVEPALVDLAGPDRHHVLGIAMSGSGARYTGRFDQGEALFWQKGPEAIVQLPGGPEQNCRVGPLP